MKVNRHSMQEITETIVLLNTISMLLFNTHVCKRTDVPF